VNEGAWGRGTRTSGSGCAAINYESAANPSNRGGESDMIILVEAKSNKTLGQEGDGFVSY